MNEPDMPASPPPVPAPEPARPATPPAAPPASASPPPLMPYDDLFGDADAAPEPPPSLTFNVAAAPLPAPDTPPRHAKQPELPDDLPAGAIIVGDERPPFVPPRAADEPPEPLLDSPIEAAPPAPFVAPPPPPAPPVSISGLFDKVAPVPVAPRPRPEPTASRPMPLADEPDYTDSAYDTLIMPHASDAGRATPPSADPGADTVIAVSAPARGRLATTPSMRLLGLLTLLLLALWIARLGASPLFDVDEGAFSEATRELVTGHDWGSTTLNGADRFDKPILVYWLQAVSMKTFGVSEFATRLPSALCAFLWCLAIGQFAWRRYGPPVAIAAAGILATSLGPMLIGRAATADSLLNLLLTLSTLDLWRHLENGRDAPRRRAFAFIGLGLLAKGPVAFLIPAAAAALWLLAGLDRSRLVRLLNDRKAWLLMIAIAAPWYAYALWRHGMAFVDGFLLHHNLDRFTGSLEGHKGSLFYYFELLPALMLPWAALLAPLLLHLRARWREPLGRFLLLWLGFVLVFFSLSGTKLPHYVLYGFTPLILLVAQELVVVGLGVRIALCLTTLALVIAGAASPWIAHAAAQKTTDALYQTLLATAPAAPWVWLAVPVALLVFALSIWVPNVRHYLTNAEGAIFAAALSAAWLVVAVMPWWGQTLQEPIRTLARALPVAQLNLMDRQPLVQWKLHQPSIGFYVGQPVERHDPTGGDWALTRVDRFTPADLSRMEIVQQERGFALVRPASAASEPLARIGAAQTAAAAASAAAFAASEAEVAAALATEAAAAASQAAANASAAGRPARASNDRPTPP